MRSGTKWSLLVLATGMHDHRGRLGELVPDSGKVGKGLGDDQAVLVAQALEARILGVKFLHRAGIGRDEQRARPPRSSSAGPTGARRR